MPLTGAETSALCWSGLTAPDQQSATGGVLHVSWTVTKNRFNRTCEVKSVSCPHQRFSEEFKQQVVLEVVEKTRTISDVAKSYSLAPQTVRMLGEQVEENPFRNRE